MNMIYTVGHSSHTLEHFLSLLKKHDITVVTDVRSTPYSRHNPQFNRESLSQALKAIEIGYVFLGKELGARSEDPDCYVEGQARYELIAQTPLYQEGLSRVLRGAASYRIGLMCAEADPVTCHRTILVGRSLIEQGANVAHIHGDGHLESQSALEKRLIRITGLAQGDLFTSRDAVEVAYERQGRRIAYIQRAPPNATLTPPDISEA